MRERIRRTRWMCSLPSGTPDRRTTRTPTSSWRGQMSRKRRANAVACGVLLSQVVDLHECSFGCFTLVLADAAGSPRKVPGLAAGEENLAAWAPGDWRSAYALRDRGLLRISRGGWGSDRGGHRGRSLLPVLGSRRRLQGATRRHPADLPGAGVAPCPTPSGPSLVRDKPRRPSWSSGFSPWSVSCRR